MRRTFILLTDGRSFPLSDRISTSFYNNTSDVVTDFMRRYPRTYDERLSWVSTVPNWNSPNTINTLNDKLSSLWNGSVVFSTTNSNSRLCVSSRDVLRFDLINS